MGRTCTIQQFAEINFKQYIYSLFHTVTPRTFWTIFLKIFGLYIIWQALVILPSLFASVIYIGSQDKLSLFTLCSGLVFLVCFFIAIIRYCIFRTDPLIELLRLEKGFADEQIEVNLHRSSLLKIAIIVLGGLMLADGLPLLCFNIFSYFQYAHAYNGFGQNRVSPYLVSNLLKVFFGYFMVTDSRMIVNFIERKRK